MKPDAQLFRSVAGRFATGVTVVTTQTPDGPFGMTANSFTTVSLDPLLVLVCIGEHARIREPLVNSGGFAITVLSAGQQATARRFADRRRPVGTAGFADDAWAPGPASGSPVLLDGAGWFDCTVDDVHPAGDHVIVVGKVHEIGCPPTGSPLLFAGGTFHTTAPALEIPA